MKAVNQIRGRVRKKNRGRISHYTSYEPTNTLTTATAANRDEARVGKR